MVKLLVHLADLVARRCFRSSGYSPFAFTLERARDTTHMEPEASVRSFRPLAVACGAGGNRVRWMASDFGAELSDLVHLRTDRHLDRVSFHAARNSHWHLYSFGYRNLGNAPWIRTVHFAIGKPIALDAAVMDGRVDDHSNGNRSRNYGTQPHPGCARAAKGCGSITEPNQ